jgi:hypothetical protein
MDATEASPSFRTSVVICGTELYSLRTSDDAPAGTVFDAVVSAAGGFIPTTVLSIPKLYCRQNYSVNFGGIIGDSIQLTVTGTKSDGTQVDITATSTVALLSLLVCPMTNAQAPLTLQLAL